MDIILCGFLRTFILTFLFQDIISFSLTEIDESRIIKGEEASPDDFPWHVTFTVGSDFATWTCGGAIINEKWILTAAHCLDNGHGAYMTTNGGQELYSYEEIMHDGFDSYTLSNDIAVFSVGENITFSDSVKPIDISSSFLGANVNITVSGSGQTSDSGSSSGLHYTNLTTIENSVCEISYGTGTILDGMICAVSATANSVSGTCFGDTGSAAIIYDGDTPVHVGVATFISDRGCEYGDPSGFASTAYYNDWILSKIQVS